MIRPRFRQAAVPWKATAARTRASGANRVSTKRGALQPGSHGYYNLTSLCEDYEMTIAMKTLGLISPPHCRPWTHSMPTVAKLRGRRVRWTRGALDNLKMNGWTKVTRTYIMAQIGRLLAMMSPLLFSGVPDIALGHLRALQGAVQDLRAVEKV